METFNDPCALSAQVASKYLAYQQTKMLTKKKVFFKRFDGNKLTVQQKLNIFYG
jgi:hypothetical protein